MPASPLAGWSRLFAPQPSDNSFEDWWRWASSSANCTLKNGLDSLIILGAWSLWRHRNDCVFNGASPNLTTALTMAGDEAKLWSMAGVKGLSLLSGLVGD